MLGVLLVAGIIASWSCTGLAATVDFVHITDPHLFDKERDPENREALSWCVAEINKRKAAGENHKFVVMTGDVGLEGVANSLNEQSQHSEIVRTARDFAELIKTSQVKQWLFLPGNNDLVEENPGTIGIYREFIQVLKGELPEMEIIDFSVADFLDLLDGNTTYRFIGFDNSSFKSNDASIDAECFDATRQGELQRVAARVENTKGFAYIFYHIPEIDDPYYAAMDPANPKDYALLRDRANRRGQFGKDFPLSAWTVTPAVRNRWNAIVGDDKVKGLFAGHFHSADRAIYDDLSRLNSASYPAVESRKLFVCPPVAIKNQKNKKEQARGLRFVSLQADGSVAQEVKWLPQPSPSATPQPSATATPQGSARDCRKGEEKERGRKPADFHTVISDIESVLKSLAIVGGILAGFWAWLTYVRQRLRFPRAKLEHAVEHSQEENGLSLYVTLRVHNIGDFAIAGRARTEVRRGSMTLEKHFPSSDAREVLADLAPGESKEFYFDFLLDATSQKSSPLLIDSLFVGRSKPWRKVRRRTWAIRTIHKI